MLEFQRQKAQFDREVYEREAARSAMQAERTALLKEREELDYISQAHQQSMDMIQNEQASLERQRHGLRSEERSLREREQSLNLTRRSSVDKRLTRLARDLAYEMYSRSSILVEDRAWLRFSVTMLSCTVNFPYFAVAISRASPAAPQRRTVGRSSVDADTH